MIDLPSHLTTSLSSEKSFMSTLPDTIPKLHSASIPHQNILQSQHAYTRFILNEFSLGTGETIYGLGERFGPMIKNGQNIGMWNADGGTSSEQAYKNIPFYLSSKGYGIFVNHPEEVEFEVGREKCSKVGISVRGERLELYIIGGGSMKKVSLYHFFSKP